MCLHRLDQKEFLLTLFGREGLMVAVLLNAIMSRPRV